MSAGTAISSTHEGRTFVQASAEDHDQGRCEPEHRGGAHEAEKRDVVGRRVLAAANRRVDLAPAGRVAEVVRGRHARECGAIPDLLVRSPARPWLVPLALLAAAVLPATAH